MPLVEQRRHAIGLADLLLYDSLIEDGVLLQQDGGLLAAWKFQGRISVCDERRDGGVERALGSPAPPRRRLDGAV